MRKGQSSNLGLILAGVVVGGVVLLSGFVVVAFLGLRLYMGAAEPTHLTGPPLQTVPLPPMPGGEPTPPPASSIAIGKPAPEIEGEDIDGVKFKLSDYRGKVVVLDFWGHW